MIEVRTPVIITPETQKVKQYLRSREIDVRYRRKEIAGITSLGRGVVLDSYDTPVGEKLTGRGLCLYESLKLQEDMAIDFPQVATSLTAGEINPRDTFRTNSHRIGHFWVRMMLEDGTRLFVDDNFGQIHPLLNRTVIDFTENEMEYYGRGMRVFPYQETRSSEEIIEYLKTRRSA